MKTRSCTLAVLVAGVLFSPLATKAIFAQRFGYLNTYYSYPYPSSYPYQFGGGVGVTPYGMPGTWGAVPSGYYYYQPPQVYSYLMPSPYYGILPPPFATARSGYNGSGQDSIFNRKTAEDYGYTRDYFDGTPRRRDSLFPAIPSQEGVKKEDRQAGARRVRFDITVPHADATLVMDGAKTKQSGTQREYITPPLEMDRLYTSTIEISWVDETGKKYERKKTFEFIAGDTVRHKFQE